MPRLTSWTGRGVLPVLAGVFFLSGIDWGLPSRANDRFLFGSDRPVWTGHYILSLAGSWEDNGDRGADVAEHAFIDRTRPVPLNGTDPDRAQIIRRYRLYSYQPDEMITFRSLSRMHPSAGDLDPRFFQYGGAWVYPVGAMLKLAALSGELQLQNDLAFYMDHPESFARFYVVARLYSAAWGVVGVLLMFELTRLWARSTWAAALAGSLYAVMPVVVNAAHEAKPHLGGSVLVLATLWAATRYVTDGHRRWAWAAATLAGGAASMVWTGGAALAVLPTMVWLRAHPTRNRGIDALALLCASILVFVALNPYLPIDILFRRAVVQSNVGNSSAMYHPRLGSGSIANAAQLIGTAMTPVLAIASILSLIWLCLRCWRQNHFMAHPAWLALGPAALVGAQFLLLATDKPAEYARFSLTLDLLLVIALAGACSQIRRWPVRAVLMIGLLILTGGAGLNYVRHFRDDRGGGSSRARAAQLIASLPGTVYIHAEPAPYCLPPINLFDRQIILLPAGSCGAVVNGVDITAVDRAPLPGGGMLGRLGSAMGWTGDAPIAWGNKPFVIVGK